MKQLTKQLCMFIGLSITAVCAFATPKILITHNTTDVESNAFIAGTIPSQHPTQAHADGRVVWTVVRLACYGHIVDNKCQALIKMATNTATPVNIGVVSVDVNTGEITPQRLSNNGYTLIVNGPGETTLIKQE